MNALPRLAKELNQKFNTGLDRTEREILYKQVIKLQEEVGEVAESILGEYDDLFNKEKKYGNLEEELADVMVLIYLIADLKDIDLERVISEKDKDIRERFIS